MPYPTVVVLAVTIAAALLALSAGDVPHSQPPPPGGLRPPPVFQPSCIFGDCVDGAGIFRYENGDVFGGEWMGGRRDGLGVYTFANGRSA